MWLVTWVQRSPRLSWRRPRLDRSTAAHRWGRRPRRLAPPAGTQWYCRACPTIIGWMAWAVADVMGGLTGGCGRGPKASGLCPRLRMREAIRQSSSTSRRAMCSVVKTCGGWRSGRGGFTGATGTTGALGRISSAINIGDEEDEIGRHGFVWREGETRLLGSEDNALV